jgi:hypothetical protein
LSDSESIVASYIFIEIIYYLINVIINNVTSLQYINFNIFNLIN